MSGLDSIRLSSLRSKLGIKSEMSVFCLAFASLSRDVRNSQVNSFPDSIYYSAGTFPARAVVPNQTLLTCFDKCV